LGARSKLIEKELGVRTVVLVTKGHIALGVNSIEESRRLISSLSFEMENTGSAVGTMTTHKRIGTVLPVITTVGIDDTVDHMARTLTMTNKNLTVLTRDPNRKRTLHNQANTVEKDI
jgi:hypothetical protein